MAQLSAMDTAWQQTAGDRLASLRRMRLLATGLLVLMLAVFIVCWALEAKIPWLAYPRAFAEAGMVGACADWFAVVALFRHPLGLPIPHTAILPNNKRRIGDTLGAFFAGNFLNSTEIAARLDRVDVSGWISHWLREPENVQLLVKWSRGLLPPALELLGSTRLRGASGDLIRRGIDSIAAAPLAGRVLAVLVAQGQHDGIFDLGIETAIEFLGNNRKTIRQKTAEKSSGWIPGWVDAKLADAFVDGLLETLAAARAPDHPWRNEYRTFLDRLIVRLADDPEFYDKGERIKSDVLDGNMVDDYLAWLTAEIETNFKGALELENGVLAATLERSVAAIGAWIDHDQTARDTINRWVRQLVLSTVVPHRDEIGTYVSDVVVRWDSETLVRRLELQVGKDLQFIRINGTVVGGLVGLLLFVVTKLLG
jgi:uncharacterized membrane-anchored protein YjiN (DUF445 family)